jgi:hypothetical protein
LERKSGVKPPQKYEAVFKQVPILLQRPHRQKVVDVASARGLRVTLAEPKADKKPLTMQRGASSLLVLPSLRNAPNSPTHQAFFIECKDYVNKITD